MNTQKGKKHLTNEEQQCLKQEKQCFKCHKQGHIKINCPDKNGAPPKYTLKPFKTRGQSAITEESPAKIDKTKDLARKVQALNDKGKDVLLQAMLEDPDF